MKCARKLLGAPHKHCAILICLLSEAPPGVPEPLDDLNEVVIRCGFDGKLRRTAAANAARCGGNVFRTGGSVIIRTIIVIWLRVALTFRHLGTRLRAFHDLPACVSSVQG